MKTVHGEFFHVWRLFQFYLTASEVSARPALTHFLRAGEETHSWAEDAEGRRVSLRRGGKTHAALHLAVSSADGAYNHRIMSPYLNPRLQCRSSSCQNVPRRPTNQLRAYVGRKWRSLTLPSVKYTVSPQTLSTHLSSPSSLLWLWGRGCISRVRPDVMLQL